MLDIKAEIQNRKNKRAREEVVEVPVQVRLCFMGAFLSLLEAERFREEFLMGYEKDINAGHLVLVEDRIVEINNHHVIRIMAENSQGELFED